jgi:hypothetical protein
VTSGRLADNAVSTSKIVNRAVTTAKLGNGAVTNAKIADQAVTAGKIAYGGVTAGRLGNNSVTTDKITDGQVMGADLAAGAVTSSKIANNSVTTTKIKDGTIQAADVAVPLALSGSPAVGAVISGVNTSTDANSTGVRGIATGTSAKNFGVHGVSNSPEGYGVYGVTNASSGNSRGVYGETASIAGIALYGKNTNSGNYGWLGGYSWGGYVYNDAAGNTVTLAPEGFGIDAECYYNGGTGVRGVCSNGSIAYGIWGVSTSGYAGYFDGDVQVNGDLNVTGAKNFKIDDPLDPENMYLYHSCVESSERMNVYSANVVLDARGEAWVQLPDWFEAVNCNFRYQLTPIGAPGPNLYIAQKIQDGCFAIAGGVPGTEVSWVVMGTRRDPYAEAHPFEVEVEKPENERGSYLHPELYGMPETRSVEWATKPEAMMELRGER